MIRLSASVKLYWSPGSGVGVGACGGLARGLFGPVPFSRRGRPAWLRVRPVARRSGPGRGLRSRPGPRQRGFTFLPPGDFFGDRQPVLERGGIGLLGLGQQLRHFQFQLGDHFTGPLVADGAVFAGVGQDLGAVGGHGESGPP